MLKRTFISFILILASCYLACGQIVRGYDLDSKVIFAAKGTHLLSCGARYSSTNFSQGQMLVVEGIDSDSYTFSVAPCYAVMIRDNVAAGVRMSYRRGLVKIDEAGVDVEDVSINVDDYYLLGHKGSFEAFLRPYIPIGQSGRCALFAEIGASGAMGQSKNTDGHADIMKGTWQKSFSWEAGIYPGMTAFITDRLAVELNVGLFGFSGSKTQQIHNQVDEGKRSNFGAHFMVDVTSLAVGLSLYL